MAIEVERKYQVPTTFRLPDLIGAGDVAAIDGPDLLRLDATYYDTADLHLLNAKTTLRRRTGGHDAGWHLKRPAGADRSETTEPLTEDESAVPTTLRDAIAPLLDGNELRPVARVRNHRHEWTLRDASGTPLALIADDDVTATAFGEPDRTRAWRELEVELVEAPRSLLDVVEERLAAAGARPAGSESKLAQALATPSNGRGARAVADYLDHQTEVVRATVAPVRAADPDAVHDMRVAVRRLRSTLRTLRPLLDKDRTEPLSNELRWLGHLLGAVRDDDVMRRHLQRELDALPPALVAGDVRERIDDRLAQHAATERERLRAALSSDRFEALLASLAALRLPRLRRSVLRKRVRKALRRADRRLDRAVDRTGIDRDTGLHEARKAFKRARYAVEMIEPISDPDARRLRKRLRSLQDLLGEHHDAVEVGRFVRDLGARAHAEGANAFTYGLLYAHGEAAIRRSLEQLPRARHRARKPRGWLRG